MSTAVASHVLTAPLRGSRTRDVILVASATAFIAASAQVAIPLPFSPVPVTGQTFAVLVSVAALGPALSLASLALYVALAFAGAPVFAPNAEGLHATGVAVLSMPTLGYVAGFFMSSIVLGALAERGFTTTPLRTSVAMIAGNVTIYAFGLLWLHHALSASWSNTFAWGLTPFLIGDAVKIAIAAGLLPIVWRFTR